MASKPVKTAVEEANKQLAGMFEQLTNQEREFKEIVNEKEAEIVRLHQALKDLEMRSAKTLMDKLAKANEQIGWLNAGLEEKDQEIAKLKGQLQSIVTVVREVEETCGLKDAEPSEAQSVDNMTKRSFGIDLDDDF
eukprot:m.26340 g.26340  ORF g.26340 m.26340 type:complete len:136 (+) comp7785_c0_seq1:164-571(+)